MTSLKLGTYGALEKLLRRLQGTRGPAVVAVPLAVAAVAAAVAVPGVAAGALASGLPQPRASNSLSGVSCVSADDCWAVGSTLDVATGNVGGEVLHWNGAGWVAVSSPAVTGALESVSCASSTDCWAVGSSGDGQRSDGR